jgi:hypothetical protein
VGAAAWRTAALVLVVALFLVLTWSAAATKCETTDEGLFIGGGCVQVQLANPNVDLTHPPLLRWLAGLPATFVADARLVSAPPLVDRGPMDLNAYKATEVFNWAQAFLNAPENDHDRVLAWGRAPFALLAVVIALLAWREVRRHFGEVAAFGTVLAFLFMPEVLAHAQWAHSDLASALGLLAFALGLARSLERGSPRDDVVLGLALGLSASMKLTGLLVAPLVPVAFWLFVRPPDGRSRGALVARRVGIVAATACVVVVLAYLPQPRVAPPHEFRESETVTLSHSDAGSLAAEAVRLGLRTCPLPDTFLKGVVYTMLNSRHGQVTFFHGKTGAGGWPEYFPVGLVLKYPTPLLLLSLVGLVITLRASHLSRERKIAWILPAAFFFLCAMAQSINIGVRAILPVAPFLALWAGAAIGAARRPVARGLAAACILATVASGVLAWPHFLGWFNPLFGGIAKADRWLADSSIDWGQDLPELGRVLRRRGIREVRLAYSGAAVPERWITGVRSPDVVAPGWYAISRFYLSGAWPPGDPYAWLRRLPPTEIVGGSIALVEVGPEDLPPALDAGPELHVRLEEGRLEVAEANRRLAGAVETFGAVLERSPDSLPAALEVASALDALGRADEADSAWRRVLALAQAARDEQAASRARQRLAWGVSTGEPTAPPPR